MMLIQIPWPTQEAISSHIHRQLHHLGRGRRSFKPYPKWALFSQTCQSKMQKITLNVDLKMALNCTIVSLHYLFICVVLYFSCISVRVRVQFHFERAHYLFNWRVHLVRLLTSSFYFALFSSLIHCPWLCSHGGWLLLKCSAIGIGFNGAETNCGIARILGILVMNSCDA